MKEKGFATIFGLCMIFVFALLIRGITAAEENHGYETMYFQLEQEMQDAAKDGIYQALAQVVPYDNDYEPNDENDPFRKMSVNGSRSSLQHEFKNIIPKYSELLKGEIKIEVWGERLDLQSYETDYKYIDPITKEEKKNIAVKRDDGKEVYVIFSRATATDNQTGEKLYGRAYAYIVPNEDGKVDANPTVHFLEVPTTKDIYTLKDK